MEPSRKKFNQEEIAKRIAEAAAKRAERLAHLLTPSVPSNITVTETAHKLASSINSANGLLAVRYVRGLPTVCIKPGKDKRSMVPKDYDVVPGKSIGVLVAFKVDGDIIVGWSQINQKVSLVDGVPVRLEQKHFSKEEARQVAILRGLSDDIVIHSEKMSNSSASGEIIPETIARQLPSFVDRVQRYFKGTPVNVIDNHGIVARAGKKQAEVGA